MAKRMDEATKIGDSFFKKTFSGGIRFKTKLLFAINLILVIFVMQDEFRDILYLDKMTMQTLVSVGIIIMAVLLGIISYKLTQDLNEWEETYKKVKKILS